jgi:tetratricopeptide (TPR) repeat protein
VRGLDEEGVVALQGADDIAGAQGDRAAVAEARAELGYVDMLRAQYDRAELRLSEARSCADGAPSVLTKATAYLGVVHSDTARYASARALLEQAAVGSRADGDLRRAAFSLAMLGRLHLLRGELRPAAAHLRAALELATREHWLSYVPWPQALLGEVELARGDLAAAAGLLEQAFARACQLGDPCWEGLAARGLALLADARGDADRAFALLDDAQRRATRLADSYVWLTGYVLDAQAGLGLRHGHPGTAGWVDALGRLAARTGMRELVVRGLLHGAALGRPGQVEAARLLVADIDNPCLAALVPPPAVAEGLVPAPRTKRAVRTGTGQGPGPVR